MLFPQKAKPTPWSSICPQLARDLGGHTVRCGKKTPLIWGFWLERISPTKRRDLRPFERKCYALLGKRPVPRKTAHSESPDRAAGADRVESSSVPVGAALVLYGRKWHGETAYARPFQTSCWGRSPGRLALSKCVKMPSEASTCRWGARQLLSRLRPERLALSPHLALFCVASAPMASERLWRMYQVARRGTGE